MLGGAGQHTGSIAIDTDAVVWCNVGVNGYMERKIEVEETVSHKCYYTNFCASVKVAPMARAMPAIMGVTRGERGHNSPGAESLCRRRITAGDAKWLRGASKSPNNVTGTFFNQVNLLPKDLRFEHGGAKFASFPEHHLTPFRPCLPWNHIHCCSQLRKLH